MKCRLDQTSSGSTDVATDHTDLYNYATVLSIIVFYRGPGGANADADVFYTHTLTLDMLYMAV